MSILILQVCILSHAAPTWDWKLGRGMRHRWSIQAGMGKRPALQQVLYA